MSEFKGSWALVTGAGRGIGREFARELARKGIHVIGVARTESDLTTLAEECRALGASFRAVPLDLASPGALESLLTAIEDLIPSLRVVCLNAAITAFGRFDEIPRGVHETVLSLNAIFPVRLTHALLPELKKRPSARILFLSSQAAMQPVPWMAVYAASKHFLTAFSLALAHETRGTPVRVVTVVPSHTRTSAFDTVTVPEAAQALVKGGLPASEIAGLMAHALDRPDAWLVTNVRGFSLLRMGIGLTPLRWLTASAGRMFSAFSGGAYFPARRD